MRRGLAVWLRAVRLPEVTGAGVSRLRPGRVADMPPGGGQPWGGP